MSHCVTFFTVFFFTLAISASGIDTGVVNVEQGELQGTIKRFGNKNVDFYLGIPYAKAPLNEDTFARPKKAEKWEGVKRVDKFAPACYYQDSSNLKSGESKDCLYLNVFVPGDGSLKPKDGFPVLFFIHGGAYIYESAEHYGSDTVAELLPTQDIIVVTFNYRLGVLGFYSNGNESAPGNQGLWDMAEALHWTYNNIKALGGDPNRITVAGHSAGSMSAEILSLSPVTSHMVYQVYLMSGTNDFQWEPVTPQLVYDSIFDMATVYFLSYKGSKSDSDAFTDFLISQNPENLHVRYSKNGEAKEVFIWPVYDGHLIPEKIAVLRQTTKRRPTLVGCTRYEGMLLIDNPDFKKAALQVVARHVLKQEDYKETKHESTANNILNRFSNENSFNETQEYRQHYMELMSDIFFNTGIYRYVMQHTSTSEKPIYVYRFDYYYSKYQKSKERLLDGSTHGDDIPFVLGQFNIKGDEYNYEDTVARKQFSKFIANFVKYGRPNGPVDIGNRGVEEWPPVDLQSKKLNHMVYNYYDNHMSDNWFEERHFEWIKIRKEYQSYSTSAGYGRFVGLMLLLLWLGW